MLPCNTNVNAMPRKVRCALDIGNDTITDVKKLTYATDWSGQITVGQVVSAYISATIPTPSFSLAGANVSHSMGIGNPVEWVRIGTYRIDEESIRTRQGYTSFSAYDKLRYAINTYQSALTFPVTLQAICNEVCGLIGITSTALPVNPTIEENILDGYTLRDVLGFIAGYCGRNAYLSPYGTLELRWFSSVGYTADGTRANIPYIGENNCTVSRLICQTSDGVLTSGSGEGIYFTCPFMTQARLNAMLSGLSMTYRKADVDIPYGNFLLQSGDIITVSTTGSNLSVPIMNNSWSYDGGLSSAVTSYGVSDYTGTANNAEHSLSATRVQRQMAVNRASSDLKIASEKITGASGGYIRINFGGDGKTAALLIMDTEDISTAQNVWAFNQGGLGHFPNGYDPTAQANVALTYDGWVVAERISGTLISGVGIENVDNALTTKPKIALANGCIHFTETYDYSGTSPQVTDIGKLEYLARSSQSTAATLALTCQHGNNITIGEYGYPKFVYISDHGNDETFRMYGKMKMWDDDSSVSAVYSAQTLIDIVDSSAKKNLLNYTKMTFGNASTVTFNADDTIERSSAASDSRGWTYANREVTLSLSAGKYVIHIDVIYQGNTQGVAIISPSSSILAYVNATNQTATFTLSDATDIGIMGKLSEATIRVMLCKKEFWDISDKFAPYYPSIGEVINQ